MSKLNSRQLLKSHGIISGLLMTLVMLTLSISGDYKIGLIKYLKYIPLVIILNSFAIYLKPKVKKYKYFPKILVGGLGISAIAGAFLFISTLVVFGIIQDHAPMKFNLLPTNWLDATTIAVMLFVETIALGFIFNFIIFQYHKIRIIPSRSRA